MTGWKAFGYQRTWGDDDGSTWTEDDGPNGTWTVKCTGTYDECDYMANDLRDSRGCYNYATARKAMVAADEHIRAHHTKRRKRARVQTMKVRKR